MPPAASFAARALAASDWPSAGTHTPWSVASSAPGERLNPHPRLYAVASSVPFKPVSTGHVGVQAAPGILPSAWTFRPRIASFFVFRPRQSASFEWTVSFMPISLRDNLLLALLQLEVLGLLRLQGELEGRLCILTRV